MCVCVSVTYRLSGPYNLLWDTENPSVNTENVLPATASWVVATREARLTEVRKVSVVQVAAATVNGLHSVYGHRVMVSPVGELVLEEGQL